MFYGLFADIVVVVHFAFVLFSVFGGFLVLRWRRCAWIQVPVFLWAALIEFEGWICPLTPLENWFREQGGEAANQMGLSKLRSSRTLPDGTHAEFTNCPGGVSICDQSWSLWVGVRPLLQEKRKSAKWSINEPEL